MGGAGRGARERVATRVAGVGLSLVLVALTVFAVGVAVLGSRQAEAAASGGEVSHHYQRARYELVALEGLRQKWLLDRTDDPEFERRYASARAAFGSAVEALQDGGQSAEDQQVAEQLWRESLAYLAAVDRTLASEDDDTPVPREGRVDDLAAHLQSSLEQAGAGHQRRAEAALAELRRTQASVVRVTPVVFAVGLLLIVLAARVLRAARSRVDVLARRHEHDALHDGLTGLPNRAFLTRRLDAALRTAGPGSVALLLLDLDRFKEINDTLGHFYGDEVLLQVAGRLSRTLPRGATAARLGGDEFAVLVEAPWTAASALDLGSLIAAVVEEPIEAGDVRLHVEASIGVARNERAQDDASTLLRRADLAMYASKEQGRRVTLYDAGLEPESVDRPVLLGDLRQALGTEELVLHYQPKLDAGSGALIGVEALLRWQHPERGVVPPGRFLPLAENTGLITGLTRHVLDAALGQVRRWLDQGRAVPVAVNLSARNLGEDDLVEHIAARLMHWRVPPELLKVEITESALLSEPVRARRLLAQLQELGVEVALDDFGAGATSLAHLVGLPLSELKLDRSLVAPICEDPRHEAVVSAVVSLAHDLGLRVVAEGIESADVWDKLVGLGCDIGQGYYLSPPQEPAALQHWLPTPCQSPRVPAWRVVRRPPLALASTPSSS